MQMKLRKIGNSLGTTFSKSLLEKAGFSGSEDLEITAATGELRIRRASGRLMLELTPLEAEALAAGKFESKAGKSAIAKIRLKLKPE
jgi:antitoxin component of MazEF toxin-antitoxin module